MKQTRYLILSALFAVLTALGTFVRIPMPVSSFTLQTFFCAMAGLLLGSRWGAVSQVVYLLLGLIGLPVFTAGGGIGAFLTPTGGFLLGLIPMAWLAGKVRGSFRACFAGLLALYAVGLPWMHIVITVYLQKPWSLWQTLLYGMVIFLPWDILKMTFTAWLCRKIRPRIL